MATRSEQFRYEMERSGPKRPPQERHPRGRADGGEGLPHNASERAAHRAGYALEVAPGHRPSRKSSRKGANRQKTDAQTRMKHLVAEVHAQHAR